MKMQGFFNDHLEEAEANADCEECGLYKDCNSPHMEPTGKGKLGILACAEAPGHDEDEEGEQLIGKAGKLFQEFLDEFGLDLKKHFKKTNAVICRPPKNRTPSGKELSLCRKNLINTIVDFQPKAIWLMGGSAVDTFFASDPITSGMGISHLRGRAIPYHQYNCWVFPMSHPSYILRNNDRKTRGIFYRDIKHAVESIDNPLPSLSFLDNVNIITQEGDIESLLRKTYDEKPTIIFDYETNAISPYRENPKIRCISLQYADKKIAHAFPYQYQNNDNPPKRIVKLWGNILASKDIKKVGQNINFETHWGFAVLRKKTRGWIWDTMVNTHILEGPTIGGLSGTCGLKEQAFLRWGIIGYEDEIDPFMKKVDHTGQNSLHKAPLNTLLKYCAIDTLTTKKLWKEQEKEFDPFLTKGGKFFHSALSALFTIELDGINLDTNFYERADKKLTRKADKVEGLLLASKEARKFKKKYGREIGLGSSKDMRDLFYSILKMKPIKFTESTKDNEDEDTRTASVDKSVMNELENQFAKDLVQYRKILKLRDTYVAQFKRYDYEGKMHPTNNLHVARTYRSSTSNPNSQNIPKRDKEAEKVTRGGIIPSPGNYLMEVDYKAMEVRILACFTRDPILIDYIIRGMDMHMDEAIRLFGGPLDSITDTMRYHAKNGWVFPEFYGSWYENCAKNIWALVDKVTDAKERSLRDHIKKYIGVSTEKGFIKHLQECEYDFWKKYYVSKKWQKKIMDSYEKELYVEMPFGFRRGGILSKNKIINTGVQGTAFHCLLWSLIRLVKREFPLYKFQSKVKWQIHDSMINDIFPPESKKVKGVIRRVMCDDIREAHPFIIVPLDIDMSASPIDGSWFMIKKEI